MKAALRNREDGGWLRRGLDTPGWGSGQMGVSWVLGVGRSGPQTRVAAPSRHLTDGGQMGRPLLSRAGLEPDPQPVSLGLGFSSSLSLAACTFRSPRGPDGLQQDCGCRTQRQAWHAADSLYGKAQNSDCPEAAVGLGQCPWLSALPRPQTRQPPVTQHPARAPCSFRRDPESKAKAGFSLHLYSVFRTLYSRQNSL